MKKEIRRMMLHARQAYRMIEELEGVSGFEWNEENKDSGKRYLCFPVKDGSVVVNVMWSPVDRNMQVDCSWYSSSTNACEFVGLTYDSEDWWSMEASGFGKCSKLESACEKLVEELNEKEVDCVK